MCKVYRIDWISYFHDRDRDNYNRTQRDDEGRIERDSLEDLYKEITRLQIEYTKTYNVYDSKSIEFGDIEFLDVLETIPLDNYKIEDSELWKEHQEQNRLAKEAHDRKVQEEQAKTARIKLERDRLQYLELKAKFEGESNV